MKIPHTTLHYAIGAAAIGIGALSMAQKNHNVYIEQPVAGHVETVKESRFAWPALGQDKTIQLGEALAHAAPGKVTIFCNTFDCRNFRTDLDDAMQIADWNTAFEDRFVDSESEEGLFVGPPGADAESLASVLHAATGVDIKIVPISDIEGVGIIIGKHVPASGIKLKDVPANAPTP